MVKKPAYLFQKLSRHIGISTLTGDFYDLSPEAFHSLKQWNEEFSSFKSCPSLDAIQELNKKYNIPHGISELFPLSQGETVMTEEGEGCLTDITLNLTSSCNLRCAYCWNDYGRYSNTGFSEKERSQSTQANNDGHMPVQIARKAVDMLVELSGEDKDLVVDFYGGEPLMNLDTLLTTVDYCRGNQESWGVNFNFLLATNGTLFTPEVAEKLFQRGVQIAVSIDGRKEVHDNNRPFLGGRSSFDSIVKNLKGLPEEIRQRLVGRTTVTPYYSDKLNLYEDLRTLGFERIELFESEDACHKITPQREKFFFNTDAQYHLLCKEYERLALHYIDETVRGFLDYKKTFFNRFFKLMQRLYYNHEVTGGCPAAKGQFAVSVEGDIYPCTSFLGVENFKLGNVMKGINKEKYDGFIESIRKRFEHCKECPVFMLCRTTGSCLNINYYFNADPSLPYERSCNLFREKLELAAATLAILAEKIPDRLEELFGFDAVGKRGNKLY